MAVEIASRISVVGRAADYRERGFTLLEVIVAIALAALALVALFQAGSAGLLSVGQATRLEMAVDRAQSHLAEFAGSGAITPGDSEGDDGDGFHWRLTARPIMSQATAETSNQPAPPTVLYDIGVRISWGIGRRQRSVQLETERISGAGTSR